MIKSVKSISPTFYEQLLCTKIPKAQKKLLNLTVFFALLGSVRIKAALRTLVKLTPSNLKTLIWQVST